MHEWALAEAILAAASEAAEKEHLKTISKVKIKLGELQQVEQEILQFAFKQLKTGKFQKAKFAIETQKAQFKCRACGNTWTFSIETLDKETSEAIHFLPEVAHTYVKCPKCGSPDFEILEGRGIWLETVTGER
jgi:hydrogenase nickel incorporation protein HypA/HybF